MTGKEISYKILQLELQKQKELDKYDRKIKDINIAISQVRKLCKHIRKRYCMGSPYDPSYYECEDCGKEI